MKKNIVRIGVACAKLEPFEHEHNASGSRFQEVSENFVLCQLRGVKTSKAVGFDHIRPWLLKDAARIIAKPLTDIINVSLHQAKAPVKWKSAHAIALFKKGDVNNIDNYRLYFCI